MILKHTAKFTIFVLGQVARDRKYFISYSLVFENATNKDNDIFGNAKKKDNDIFKRCY